jgi:site-specific DNA-methyltransferase (adenine-specific)
MTDIELIHGDSLQALKGYTDNHFDVAIVDPPYGLGFDGEKTSMTISPNMESERKKFWKGKKVNQYTKKDWDKEVPPKEYWDELFRVSKNQIVWGGNHFELPQSRGWIFWDKKMDKGFSLADGELAWT